MTKILKIPKKEISLGSIIFKHHIKLHFFLNKFKTKMGKFMKNNQQKE